MAASRQMALGLAWLALAAGCGGGAQRADGGSSELARAEASLQAELEAAVDRLGMAAEPGERVAPTRCDDGARQDVTSGYRVRLALPGGEHDAVLRRAEAFWRERGRRVRVVSRTGAFPAVFATADPGWTFALQLFPERGEAVLSGGTPCLPDPEA
jgi:hypothetical protein